MNRSYRQKTGLKNMVLEVNWILEFFKVSPTVIVGLMVAFIAWQQMQISKEQKNIAQAKLKLDLFSKRLTVYENVLLLMDFAENLNNSKDAISALNQLIKNSHEATFLFGDEVNEYIEKLALAVYDLGAGISATVDNNGVVPADVLPKIRKANDFIKNSKSKAVFQPYLDFSKWR